MTGSIINKVTRIEGIEPAAGESIRTHYVSAVSSDYFRALGIPLRQGRWLGGRRQSPHTEGLHCR